MAQKKIDYSTHNAMGWLIGGLRPSDREAMPNKDFRDWSQEEIINYYR